MRYLDLTLPTAAENLALDEALLEQAESAAGPMETLRLWEPAQYMVVVGRSSKVDAEVDRDTCKAMGIPVLRRVSGGAAIVTGPGCLMYSLVLSYELRPRLHAINAAHCFVLSTMVDALTPVVSGVRLCGTSDLAIADTGRASGTPVSDSTGRASGTQVSDSTGRASGTQVSDSTGRASGTQVSDSTGGASGTPVSDSTGGASGTPVSDSTGRASGTQVVRHSLTYGASGTRFQPPGEYKFSGNSMRCRKRHFLYHGTILYDFPLELISRCLRIPPRMPDYRQRRDHEAFVMNLPLSADAIRRALVSAWNAEEPLDEWPSELTASLAAEKYSDPRWNQ
jgi:lipoate-protein ligase A